MNLGAGSAQGPIYRVELAPEVADIVRGLPPEVKRQVKQALTYLRNHPDAGKILIGELAGLRSYRARRFRIVYQLAESPRCVLILYVGHRRTVYEELTRWIKNQQRP